MNKPLARARAVLSQVLESADSDFYRRKYGSDAGVAAALAGAEWSGVPFLTRADIQETSFWQRVFAADKKLVETIRPTSGTSGKGLLLVPRFAYVGDMARREHISFHAQPMRRLATFSGAHYMQEFNNPARINTLQLLAGDIPLSASLIEKYKPDALAGFPYALVALAPLLSAEARARIIAVQIFGELCTRLEWEFLKAHFPSAPFFVEYSSLEAQTPVATTCRAMALSGEPYVHPIDEFAYVELIDGAGRVITEPDVPGEIVITTLRPVLFPLVRYRTGDAARIVCTSCTCGAHTPLLNIEGRVEIDRLRIRGGEINVAEVDRVLASLKQYLSGHSFEVRFKEVLQGGMPVPRITVACSLASGVLPEELALKIASALRIAPDRTYGQGVAAGEYAPLMVVNRPEALPQGKRVRIVRE